MSIDQQSESQQMPPVSSSFAVPLIERRETELLDAAATMTLVDDVGGVESLRTAIATVASVEHAAIEADGRAQRAVIAGEIAALTEEIVHRTETKQRLEADYATRARLRTSRGEVQSQVRSLEADLLQARHAAEDRRLDAEIEQLKRDWAEQIAAEASSLPADTAVGASDHRAGALGTLEDRLEHVTEAEAPNFAREEKLRARSITATVAGFLLWLGYGSVFATGTVLALIMDGPNALQFGALIEGWRAVVASVAPGAPVWQRLFAVIGVIVGLLGTGGLVLFACDWFLRKSGGWLKEKRERDEASTQLGPHAISRRSHMQYIAALPFVFCGGVLLTLVVIAPAALAPGASGLLSLLPTVGYTFVGTAIAFLSTAVFAMYVIRIVEPRLADGPARGGFRASWEFAVPPLLLLLALALTPSLVNVAIHAWLPWIAFMLASSLCLACGLVYYGIFKDAKKGRNRIDRLQRRIDKLRGVFSDADEGDGEDGGFVAQLRHLHDVRRELRLARIGVAPSAQTVTRAGVFRDVLQWFRRKRRSNTNDAGAPSSMSANILNGGYRPVDFENSAELVSSIERERARLAAIEAELVDIDRAIETSEKLVEYEALMGLVRRRELACSRRDASPHVDSLRKANVSAIEQLLLIRVRTAAGSATAAKPFFNGERQAIATEVPYSENANEPGGPNE